MKFKKLTYKTISAFVAVLLLLNPANGFSYYLWSPESGKFVSSESQSQDYAEELFQSALSFQKQNKIDRAIEEFKNLIRKYPTAPNASEAQYQIGAIFEERKDYDKAVEAYKKVTENYPQSERADAVTERLFKIANLYMTGEKAKLVGLSIGSGLPKAADIFEHIVKTAPYSTYGDQAQFNAGLTYKKMGRYQTAMEAFQKVVDQYPSSSLIDDARYQAAETSFEYSKRATQDEKAIDQAIEKISDFLAHYPESSVTDKIIALRKEISNRDAEKNYRIGLYYEGEKQLESAALYYDDVAKRYPDAEYGKLAAKKLENLKEPLEKLKREQRDMAIEMESVGAKLKSIRSEQDATSDDSRTKDLENQIGSLKKQQKDLLSDQLQVIKDREIAWRRADKEWREKWKAFQAKRKDMRSNQSPELSIAFQRWEKSLMEEKDKLTKEQETISLLRKEVRIEPEPKLAKRKKARQTVAEPLVVEKEKQKLGKSWLRLFRKSHKGKRGDLEALADDLSKIRVERERVFKERAEREAEVDRWQTELSGLPDQSFESALTQSWFMNLAHEKNPGLKQTEKLLNKHRSLLNRRIREFEMKKALHEKQFNALDSGKWSLTFSVEGFDVDEFVTSGVDLNQAIRDLQQDKARLADLWTEQKQKVATIANAFSVKSNEVPKSKSPAKEPQTKESTKDKKSKKPSESLTSNAARLKDALPRTLKKRIKFLEREIRQRFDEIEDWNSKKDQSIAELNRLMQEGDPHPTITKITNRVTAPVRFAFWLARSLTFGLSDSDRRIVKKAKRKENSEDESGVKVRQLHEQIELQSLLIQGRVAEINQFEQELKELKKMAKSKQVDLIPIYTERDFAIGEESLRSASRIVATENRTALLIDKLNTETIKLQSIEQDLKVVNAKIAKLNSYQQTIPKEDSTKKGKEEKNQDDFEADTASESKKSSPEQLKSESRLSEMKKRIERYGQKYQAEKQSYRNQLKKIYSEFVEGNPKLQQSPGVDRLNEKNRQLSSALENSRNRIKKLRQMEKKLLKAEEGILLKKKQVIQSRLDQIKDISESQEKKVLISELESTEIELASVKETSAQSLDK